MLPIQQDIQFPQREIDLIQSDEPSLQNSSISVTQISNVQEQPSTSRNSRVNADTLESYSGIIGKPLQQEILTSLLMIMVGEKEFTHFTDQIAGMGYSNNLELVSAVCCVQTALFDMKTHIAELVALEKEKTNEIKNRRDKTEDVMAAFYKKGAEYYQLLNKAINGEQKNQPLQKKNNKQNYALQEKEKAEKRLKISIEAYNEKCKKRNLNANQITNYIRDYFREEKCMDQIARIFFFLSIYEIRNIIKTIVIPQITLSQKLFVQPLVQPLEQFDIHPLSTRSGSAMQPPISPFAEQQTDAEQEMEFTILRKPVREAFWHSLETLLTKEDYIKKFYQFVHTNWNNDYETEKALKRRLLKAKKENNLPERYNLLLQKHFQKKFKTDATRLIYHILKAKNYQSGLADLKGDDLVGGITQRNCSIGKLNRIAEEHYYRSYLGYQKREDVPTQLIEKKIIELEKKCADLARNIRQVNDYLSLNLPKNVKYVNNVLRLLRHQGIVTTNNIKFLILNDQSLMKSLNSRANFQPKAVLGKRSCEPSQECDDPPQKKLPMGNSLPVGAVGEISLHQSRVQVDSRDKITEQVDCSSEQSSLISFEPLPLMPQQEIVQQRKLSFVLENTEEWEPSVPATLARELAEANFTPFIDNSNYVDHELIPTQSTASASEYLASASRKIQTNQKYRDIYKELLSVEDTAISGTEMTALASSFHNSQLSSQEESEPSASRIETEFESLEPSLNEETEQVASPAPNDERQTNLSASEEDENELQDIFPSLVMMDLQTHISTELEDDIDFNDTELLNSLDHILSEHLYSL